MVGGKTVGHHYAGPRWALADGSIVQGKVSATVAGATSTDIPQLKLDVIAHEGTGALTQATLVNRVRTHGGTLAGPMQRGGYIARCQLFCRLSFQKIDRPIDVERASAIGMRLRTHAESGDIVFRPI